MCVNSGVSVQRLGLRQAQKSGGQVQLCHSFNPGTQIRHASVMQCQVFVESPAEYFKYECELF